MDDPEVFKEKFESKNWKYSLWYTPHVMNRFKSLRKEIYDWLEREHDYWDGSVDILYELI